MALTLIILCSKRRGLYQYFGSVSRGSLYQNGDGEINGIEAIDFEAVAIRHAFSNVIGPRVQKASMARHV